MSETPAGAMRRFIETFEPVTRDAFPSIYKTEEDAFDDGATIIAAFLANPARHKEHIRLILEGISTHVLFAAFPAISRVFKLAGKVPIFGNLLRANSRKDGLLNTLGIYAEKLIIAREDLLSFLTPGDLEVDILPVVTRKSDIESSDYNVVVFQLNVALWPKDDFTPQSLSVLLKSIDTDVHFVDVSPTSRTENVGSYKMTVNESGKLTYTNKETVNASVGFNVGGAKMDSNIARERTTGNENTSGFSVEESRQTFASLIMSSAVKGIARWGLLAAPSQPLIGGTVFLATALVPSGLPKVTMEARVRAELEHYGDHQVTVRRDLKLPTVSSEEDAMPFEHIISGPEAL